VSKQVIIDVAKRLVRQSPIGPSAVRFYRRYLRAAPAPLSGYDRDTVEVMQRLLRPDSSCIDVGAHNGTILRWMLELSPRGTHFAFEPLPHLAARLVAAFPTVRVHEVALSDDSGQASFIHVTNDAAYSGLRPRIYDRPDPVLQPITVSVTRLDDVVPPEQLVAFIKIDVEGGEFHVLRGATRTIRRCRPVIVFEAGAKSTGQYGVEPEDVYELTTAQLGCHLSTMRRWLSGLPPYVEAEFRENWRSGAEFYFIAYPMDEIVPAVPRSTMP
jgi:FkbM family methyltransferase